MTIETAPYVRDGLGQWPLPLAKIAGPNVPFFIGPSNCMWFANSSNIFPGPVATECAGQGAPYAISPNVQVTTALMNLTFTQVADPNGWTMDNYSTLAIMQLGDALLDILGNVGDLSSFGGPVGDGTQAGLFLNNNVGGPREEGVNIAVGLFPDGFFGTGPTTITLILSATPSGWVASCPEAGISLSLPYRSGDDETSIDAAGFGGTFGWSDTGNQSSVTLNVASVNGVPMPWCQDTTGTDPNTFYIQGSGDFPITQVPITALPLYPYTSFPPPISANLEAVPYWIPGSLIPATLTGSQAIDVSGMVGPAFALEGVVTAPDVELLIFSQEIYYVYEGEVAADFVELGYGTEVGRAFRSPPQYLNTADHVYTTFDVDGRSLQIGWTPGIAGFENFIQLCSGDSCVLVHNIPDLVQGVPMKFHMEGTFGVGLRAKVWQAGSAEPSCWMAQIADVLDPGEPTTFTVSVDAQHHELASQPVILFDDFAIFDTTIAAGSLDYGWGCETPLHVTGRTFTTTRAWGNGTLAVYVNGKRLIEGPDWWALWDGSGANMAFEIADNVTMDLVTNGCGEQVPQGLNVCYLPTRDLTNTRFQSPKNLKLNVDANKIQMFDIRGFN